MSDDILEKLRVAAGAEIERLRYDAPLRRRALIHRAADEIERLRARVEVLETALRHYAEDEYNGYNADGACARAALEAKP
jgi:hypothetical protein